MRYWVVNTWLGLVQSNLSFFVRTYDCHIARLLFRLHEKVDHFANFSSWDSRPLLFASIAHSTSFVPFSSRFFSPHSSGKSVPSITSQSCSSSPVSRQLCIKTSSLGYGSPRRLRVKLEGSQTIWTSLSGTMTKQKSVSLCLNRCQVCNRDELGVSQGSARW